MGYFAERKAQMLERFSPRKIVEIADAKGCFTASLRYRDDFLLARCASLEGAGVLRSDGRIHRGEYRFEVSRRFKAAWDLIGDAIFEGPNWPTAFGLDRMSRLLLEEAARSSIPFKTNHDSPIMVNGEPKTGRRWAHALRDLLRLGGQHKLLRKDKAARVYRLTEDGEHVLARNAEIYAALKGATDDE